MNFVFSFPPARFWGEKGDGAEVESCVRVERSVAARLAFAQKLRQGRRWRCGGLNLEVRFVA